jgi:Recombination endonuclease VII
MTAVRENPLGHVVSQLGVITPQTPARRHCPNSGPRPSWLPPREFHCAQDHYLQGTYGITCDDYWGLYERQDGRCAICRLPPKGRRLVVDHDHDTGRIDGLCHFGCNRRLTTDLRRYLSDPPAGLLCLAVSPAKLRALKAKDAAKRRRDREQRTKPPPTDHHKQQTRSTSFADQIRNQEGTT